MAGEETTPIPQTTISTVLSLPATPPTKRARMSSQTQPKQEEKVESEQPQVAETQQAESTSNIEGTGAALEQLPPADQRVEIV